MRKKIILFLLITFLICSIVYIVFLQKKNSNCNTYNKNIESVTDKNVVSKEKEYDCTFTQTYRVVNLLDGYIAEVPELSYVILDKFLTHQAISHIIPMNQKNKLESGKYYEFTYQLKGKGYIENMNDIYQQISSTELYKGYIENMNDIYQQISSTELYNQSDEKTKKEIYKDKKMFVYLTINETTKTGVEQINEDICG